jgi:hypothetical protein
MGDLLRRQLRLGTEFHPAFLRGLHAGAGTFGHQAPLSLGQDADHWPHGAAGGGLGVDVLGQRAKRDALGARRVQQRHEIALTLASAVQFPDNEGIAWSEGCEAAGEGRALHRRV